MQLVDDGMAQQGQVIWAAHQSSGKGQRGKKWENDAGNLMMSLIVKPALPPDKQFLLSMTVAVTLANYLQNLYNEWQVAIKWPNDIYINDKKACGILIENVLRGMEWSFAIIGIGLNVNQTDFPKDLVNATSLRIAAQKKFELLEIIKDLRAGIINESQQLPAVDVYNLLNRYNNLLFRKGQEVTFRESMGKRQFQAFVQEVDLSGRLILLSHQGIEQYRFGELEWILS